MNLGVSTWSYREALDEHRLDLSGVFTEASRLGLKCIDAAGAHFASVNDVLLNELMLCRRRTGVRVGCLTLANDFGHPDVEERRQQIVDLQAWMDIMVRLEVKVLCVRTGKVWPGVGPERTREWVTEAIRRVVDEALKRSRVVAIEDPWKTFASGGELLKRVGKSKAAGLALDVNASGEDWEAAGGRPTMVRIRVTDEGVDATPGLVKRLRSLEQDVCVSLEYVGDGDPGTGLKLAVETLKPIVGQ